MLLPDLLHAFRPVIKLIQCMEGNSKAAPKGRQPLNAVLTECNANQVISVEMEEQVLKLWKSCHFT